MTHQQHFAAKLVILMIRTYQSVMPGFVRNACRFDPSCSHYAIESIEKHGLLHGSKKMCARIIRCRPPNGGIDHP